MEVVVPKTQEHSQPEASHQSSKRNFTIQSYALVRDHLPIVQTVARRYCRGKKDLLEDLIQVGAIGLLKAVRCYNPKHPNKASLKTLAICYIRGEIRHYLRDYAGLIHVPRRLMEVYARIAVWEERLSQELKHAPTVKELSAYSGFSEQEILEAQRCADARQYYESLDAPPDEETHEEKRSLCETMPDRKYQEWQVRKEERDYIAMGLNNLSERNRKILEHVFFQDLTQKETATKLGLSEMGVSRAVTESIKKLKQIIQANATLTRIIPPKV
jgi:RNA polymerase sigma-B factor